jgi:hypothetical protein
VSPVARNVLIIVALAAAVAFVPGGGDTAAFVGAFLSIAILTAFVLIAARFYREHRVTIFGLGDRDRALLYGALGVIVLAMAGTNRLFDTGLGSLAWFAMMAAAVFAVYTVWRHHREYGI